MFQNIVLDRWSCGAVDDCSQQGIAYQAAVRQSLASHGAGVVSLEPLGDLCLLVRESICCHDGMRHYFLRTTS